MTFWDLRVLFAENELIGDYEVLSQENMLWDKVEEIIEKYDDIFEKDEICRILLKTRISGELIDEEHVKDIMRSFYRKKKLSIQYFKEFI